MTVSGLLGGRDLDFRDFAVRDSVHGIHPYPAMMVAPLAGLVIEELTSPGDLVLDPFCGSATVVFEAAVRSRAAVGVDINPLALLIGRAKLELLSVPEERLASSFRRIEEQYRSLRGAPVPRFKNISFWFKEEVQKDLARLKSAISLLEDEGCRSIFWAAFARTVREVSNTRKSEFKLYRMPEEKLAAFCPDVWATFAGVCEEILSRKEELGPAPRARSYWRLIEADLLALPDSFLAPGSVALVLTSPPYGDSRTTVAYGQFSRLALQWLDLWGEDLDKKGLGGRPNLDPAALEVSHALREAHAELIRRSPRRAAEVLSFYADLWEAVRKLAWWVREGGHAVFVVANRTVKGVELPTDRITAEMFAKSGFQHLGTLRRKILNKRMPLANSPSNIRGETSRTMLEERIVVLKKSRV